MNTPKTKKDRFTDKFEKSHCKESMDENIMFENQISDKSMADRKISKIMEERERVTRREFNEGYNVIRNHPKSISIFGSTRFAEDNPYYQRARSLAHKIVKELNYAIVTGGGPGIMEAANRGAYEAGGVSIGFTIKLPKEQCTNKYVTDSVNFEYFFTRKTILFFSAECYIFYPGGFGTLDEFFDVITSIQTEKVEKAPVILVGKEYWIPLLEIIRSTLFDKYKTIDETDQKIYKVVDSEDEIIEIIRKAPIKKD